MPRDKELWKFFEDVITAGEAEERGVTGGAVTREEAVRRHLTKEKVRKFERASGERLLGLEHEFQRPEQVARIGETEARTGEAGVRTEKARHGLEFEKGLGSVLRRLVKQREELGDLDIRVLERQLEESEPPPEDEVAKPTIPAEVAKPGKRRLRPSIRRFMWEGTPTKLGLRLPGLLAPVYGYKNIGDWLKYGLRKGYEYAYPRRK